jgi:hypothetical protein
MYPDYKGAGLWIDFKAWFNLTESGALNEDVHRLLGIRPISNIRLNTDLMGPIRRSFARPNRTHKRQAENNNA